MVTPLVVHSLEQLRALAGQQVGVSDWRTVDQTVVTAFAELTGDHEWIHVDVERAASGPFGGTVAHGYLTLALIPAFLRNVLRLDLGGTLLNYGLDRVRFPAPLVTGSRVRDRVSVTSVVPERDGWSLILRHVIESQAGQRPVCVADAVLFLTAPVT